MTAVASDGGFTTVEFTVLSEWKPGRGGSGLVAWAGDPSVFERISAFRIEFPAIPVVAVIPDLDLGSFAAAIRAGVWGAVDEAEPAAVFHRVIESALDGQISVPRHLLTAMASRIPTAPDVSAWISDDQSRWLRALAAGVTVADLAGKIGYSERETFRMLGELYQQIGVKNRTESIIWATRHGLLDVESH